MWLLEKNIGHCGIWYMITMHVANCSTNHERSAGKMEIDAILFLTSQEKYDVKYCNYIDDGTARLIRE